MKKITVLQPSDRSFEKMDDFINAGGIAFSVSRYGYEILKEIDDLDLNLLVVEGDQTFVKILKPFLKNEANNLILQIKLILKSKKYDVIYYASDRHPYLIALARWVGLCKAPILMVCHFTYNTKYVDSWFKKIALRIERRIVFKGIDKLIFLSEKIMQLSCEDYDVPNKHLNVSNWGADVNYFASTSAASIALPNEYYFSSGGALRDYSTLIDAFKKLPYFLLICCSKNSIKEHFPLPKNIIHYDFNAKGFNSLSDLRHFNQNAKAILIPISKKNHVANGNSTFVEGLACGKPILITNTGNNFLDVELSNIGMKVNMLDANDWIKKIKYLESNPLHVSEMSKNSYEIAKTKFNYALFSKNIANNFRSLVRK
jgi:glycosyltransferase involved in cell wall biosynthesis